MAKKFKSAGSDWDPKAFLWDRVRELLANHCGVGPSERAFERCVREIESRTVDAALTFQGLESGHEPVASMDALAVFLVRHLCEMEDGIDEVLDVTPDRAETGGPLYNACLETLRTSRGQFFSAEEIAERVKYDLTSSKRRRLRQLRRLLVRVCKENGARIKRANKASVTFGFR